MNSPPTPPPIPNNDAAEAKPPGLIGKTLIILLTLFGVFLTLAGVVGMVGTYRIRTAGMAVPGKITRSWVEESADGRSYRLLFAYTVANKEYTADTSCTKSTHDRFKEGTPITVQVLPDKPDYMPQIMQFGVEGWGQPIGIIVMGLLWTGLSFIGVWTSIIKPRRQRKTQAA